MLSTTSRWDRFIEVTADIPWGVLLLLAVGVLRLFDRISAEDVRGFLTAAGLFGIGHGLGRGNKTRH